jgi:hypothetical protein
MKAYMTLKRTESGTKQSRKFQLPHLILFGKGLNGDYAKVASGGRAGDRDAEGGPDGIQGRR